MDLSNSKFGNNICMSASLQTLLRNQIPHWSCSRNCTQVTHGSEETPSTYKSLRRLLILRLLDSIILL
jgi:hypothetical protein